jgi:transglutaminase-like putative cysteine protease
MTIKVALEHRTTYDFARPVDVGPHVVRLRPAPRRRTPIEAYSLKVEPAGHFVNWQQDPFGTWLARLVFPEKVSTLDITVGLVADLMVINPFDFFIEEYAERYPFEYEPDLAADLAPYLRPVDDSAASAAWRERLPALPADGVPMVPPVPSNRPSRPVESGRFAGPAWPIRGAGPAGSRGQAGRFAGPGGPSRGGSGGGNLLNRWTDAVRLTRLVS